MRRCPVQERCQHLEVCEIFAKCRTLEHMSESELGAAWRAAKYGIDKLAINEELKQRESFLRKARAM